MTSTHVCGINISVEPLTEKQKKVLGIIQEFLQVGIPPTIREIAQKMGFSSTGTVRDYLNALEKKGYIRRRKNLSRGIEALSLQPKKIPIVAQVVAGKPNLAYEDIEGYLDPDDLFLGRISQDDVFALRVKGESMIGAGIREGDIAIVKKQPEANEGDIIVALTKDAEVTIKRLCRKNKQWYLEPANENYPPIFEEFTIAGKVIAIIRKYV